MNERVCDCVFGGQGTDGGGWDGVSKALARDDDIHVHVRHLYKSLCSSYQISCSLNVFGVEEEQNLRLIWFMQSDKKYTKNQRKIQFFPPFIPTEEAERVQSLSR